MKFAKRLTALLLVVLFCVTAVPVSAAAEATLHVVSGTAKPGETVVVPIRITRIEDVASIGMHVWYDPAVLKCLDAQMSDAVASMDWANANTEPKKHPNEVWLTAISSKPVILDGDVMTITFEVLSSAPSGASPVKILDEGLSISVVTDLREIETACKLPFTGICACSNLGDLTSAEDILASEAYTQEIAEKMNLPVIMTCAQVHLMNQLEGMENIFPIRHRTHFI